MFKITLLRYYDPFENVYYALLDWLMKYWDHFKFECQQIDEYKWEDKQIESAKTVNNSSILLTIEINDKPILVPLKNSITIKYKRL